MRCTTGRCHPERAQRVEGSALGRAVIVAVLATAVACAEKEPRQPEPDSIAYYDALLSRIPFDSCAATRSDSAARALSQVPAR